MQKSTEMRMKFEADVPLRRSFYEIGPDLARPLSSLPPLLRGLSLAMRMDCALAEDEATGSRSTVSVSKHEVRFDKRTKAPPA